MTNLDTSSAGLLKPTTSAPTMISQATGTTFGTMTNGGGIAAAFDGNLSQDFTASARSATASGRIGKNYSGSARRISTALVYGATSLGFDQTSGATTITLSLYGKNGSAPTSDTDGTLLATSTFADPNGNTVQTLTSTDQSTAWDYVFVRVQTSNDLATVAEVQFYTPGTTNNLTVRSTTFTAAAVPTKMKALMRVKEVDAAVAGTDYTLECSRNGGTSWTAMALTEMFTSSSPTSGIRVVEAAETSVSGQPSGTAPRWRFKTLNNKMVELHDLYLYWS